MSRKCEITGKTSQKGNKITKAWGVKYRSIIHRKPNIRTVTLLVNGEKKRMKVSARALKSIKNGKIPGVKTLYQAN